MNREELEQQYLELGNKLPNLNIALKLKNHCYWRIANDNACKDKWNKKVKSPFYKNASLMVLKRSVENLHKMTDYNIIYEMNEQSLNYRR